MEEPTMIVKENKKYDPTSAYTVKNNGVCGNGIC